MSSTTSTGSSWASPNKTVCERELEGIVAKRVDSRYRPGERVGWIKVKNRSFWRYELDRESAISRPRERMFV